MHETERTRTYACPRQLHHSSSFLFPSCSFAVISLIRVRHVIRSSWWALHGDVQPGVGALHRGFAGEARGSQPVYFARRGGKGEVPERADSDHRTPGQTERGPRAENAGATRVRPNNPRDGGGVHESACGGGCSFAPPSPPHPSPSAHNQPTPAHTNPPARAFQILESSQTLLGVLKRESTTLTKKKQSAS